MSTTTLLVIGAGPYGLAVAAYARRRGVECRIVGESMEFWRHPELDEYFQASLPGLFFTGLAATQDFGPFFGFVRGCGASARLIVEQVVPT